MGTARQITSRHWYLRLLSTFTGPSLRLCSAGLVHWQSRMKLKAKNVITYERNWNFSDINIGRRLFQAKIKELKRFLLSYSSPSKITLILGIKAFQFFGLHYTSFRPGSKRAKRKTVSKMKEVTAKLSPTQLCNPKHVVPTLLSGQETAAWNKFSWLHTLCRKCEVATGLFPKATAIKALTISSPEPKPTRCRQAVTNVTPGSVYHSIYVRSLVSKWDI